MLHTIRLFRSIMKDKHQERGGYGRGLIYLLL
jgi:hypothetical protein